MFKKWICFLLGHDIIYKYSCNMGALFRGEQGETTAQCQRCGVVACGQAFVWYNSPTVKEIDALNEETKQYNKYFSGISKYAKGLDPEKIKTAIGDISKKII